MKLDWRLSDETLAEDCSGEERGLAYRESVRCKVFLGFTSNLISSGIRDIIRYLLQHRMVSGVRNCFLFDVLQIIDEMINLRDGCYIIVFYFTFFVLIVVYLI